MKQYSMQYESDQICFGTNNHTWGMASSIKTAKQYIKRCKKIEADRNPRNFRIYDHWADVDPATNYVPCVYQEN